MTSSKFSLAFYRNCGVTSCVFFLRRGFWPHTQNKRQLESHSNAAASLRSMRSAWWLQLWLACFAARLLAEQTGEFLVVPPPLPASRSSHCALGLLPFPVAGTPVPGKPDAVAVEPLNGNSILATYTPPLTDGGSPIHSYKVTRSSFFSLGVIELLCTLACRVCVHACWCAGVVRKKHVVWIVLLVFPLIADRIAFCL